MTKEEQFAQMNAPAYFGAVGKKILAAKTAMTNEDVSSSGGYVTHLNGVDVWWMEQGENTQVKFGRDDNGDPLYDILIPTQWLAVSL